MCHYRYIFYLLAENQISPCDIINEIYAVAATITTKGRKTKNNNTRINNSNDNIYTNKYNYINCNIRTFHLRGWEYFFPAITNLNPRSRRDAAD